VREKRVIFFDHILKSFSKFSVNAEVLMVAMFRIAAIVILIAFALDLSGTCLSAEPRNFTPQPATGLASWYAHFSPGIRETTANMERFDDRQLTCAIWDVPFNSLIRVTNLDNGRSVVVRVNDRGPAKRLVRQGRIIDLTRAAFTKIADLRKGLIRVRIELLDTREA